MKRLLLPGGLLFLVGVALGSSRWPVLALPALSFVYYCALGGGMLLAWRFHSSRIFFCLSILFLAEGAIVLFGGVQFALITASVRAVAVLVPFNFLLIAFMHERGFTLQSISPVAMLLFVESVVVAAICRVAESHLNSARPIIRSASAISLPTYALLILAGTGLVLLLRFLVNKKPTEIAMLWSLGSFFLSLRYAGDPRLGTLYSTIAVCILSAAVIETSYVLAYHDELTTLPSRRAFNDALLRLQEPYSIAVVDIDHFKRFNDTYGHDTGDQVLRLVASNLARVTGGGRAYRCGGEEFTILFPGKILSEVVAHLEELRATIESSQFRTRGNDRRHSPRGPDRRNQKGRRRAGKTQKAPELDPEQSPKSLSVTVSIGVATSPKANSNPDSVIQAADKALYRAKSNGRNRVETASFTRRPDAKAAGIA